MIVWGNHLRPYIEARIGPCESHACFMGRVRDGKLLGVLGFQHWDGENVELLWAGERGFGSRELSNAAWRYVWGPREEGCLACVRCTGKIRADNTRSLALAERMGFVREGVMRRARGGHDVVIVGMLREECRLYEQGA